MSLLVADIGNTDIKFALFEGQKLTTQWRIKDSHQLWNSESVSSIANSWQESFRQNSGFLKHFQLQGLIYCSVLPSLGSAFHVSLQKAFQLPQQNIVEVNAATMELPVNFHPYPLTQLGADRVVNTCAAHFLYPDKACIVVDFGTATTWDVVNPEGIYQGGMITVGFQTFWESLSVKTAKLPIPPFPVNAECLSIGRDTVSCMQVGLIGGYRGLMKELLTMIPSPSDQPWFYIATGGLAEKVISLCDLTNIFNVIRPTLTLEGLAAIYSKK